MKWTILAKAARVAGILILPLLSFGANERSCWLRDGAAPAPSTAYVLCEQGAIWATTDNGKTWAPRDTKATQRLRAFPFLDANRGLTIGGGGTMLATGDGGK